MSSLLYLGVASKIPVKYIEHYIRSVGKIINSEESKMILGLQPLEHYNTGGKISYVL